MKKLIFVIDDITGTGGVERVTTFLANSLACENSVSIVSLGRSQKDIFYSLDAKVKLIFIADNGFFSKNLQLANILASINADYIISMSMGRLSFRLAMLKIIYRFRSKLILSEHNSFRSSGFFIQKLKLLSYKIADHLILLTNFDKQIISNEINTEVTVIPNFSAYESEIINNELDRQKVILSVGRLSSQKGFDRAIHILSMLPRNNWKLLIIGKGSTEEEQTLNILINKAGLSDVVEIRKPTANLSEVYKIASIYMMTSRFEGLPLVLIESKSFGIPSIAFDCETGPSEIIKDNVDGFLVPNNDYHEFSQKLHLLMNDDVLRKKFSYAAIDNSKAFSQKNYLSLWRRVFNS